MDYTKGTWKVTQWNEGHGFNVFGDRFIASVPMDVGLSSTMLETRANAHLIASAPDLYEACVDVTKWVEESRGGFCPSGLSKVRKALAKVDKLH